MDENHAKSLTIQLLEEVFSSKNTNIIRVRFWDGTIWPLGSDAQTTLVLKHPGALREMFLSETEIGMAEAYLYDDVDIEGNVEKIFDLVDSVTDKNGTLLKKLQLANLLRQLPSTPQKKLSKRGAAKLHGKPHSIERDKHAVTYHYDVSSEFFALWLDPRMVYSCGYFATPEDSLEKAQEQKLHYICKKLKLRPGQRLLDIGCGWGSLIMFAAEKYGVDATGITLSQTQADYANRRIAELGLSDKCRVVVQDYRNCSGFEPYDAVVSVGMVEHVGYAQLPTYFRCAYELLKTGGIFLNHGISSRDARKPGMGASFIDTYVFPDGELPPLRSSVSSAEEAGFEIEDIESLRAHYALTLRHWVQRLEHNHDSALSYVDESTYRIWRLYMSGSASGFAHGELNVYQMLLCKQCENAIACLPLTRSDWYQTE